MDISEFVDNVQDLSDLELATLLCLIAKEHCLFETPDELIDDLASEIALIVSEIFGLSYAVISAEDLSSVDQFGDSILEQHDDGVGEFNGPVLGDLDAVSSLGSGLAGITMRAASLAPSSDLRLDTRKVANVIIAKDFNLANPDVQIQALELIRRHRIYSRTNVHVVSDVFLLIGIISTSTKKIRLNKHLNDRIFISHYHDTEDGFPNLEEIDGRYLSDDQDSTASIVRNSSSRPTEGSSSDLRIDLKIVDRLRELGTSATITPEIRRYLQDIVVFLRLERGVAGGVSPYGTVLFEALSKYLAPLHGLTFVTPSLVSLAARKIYPHRLMISTPEKERSMQYGSDIRAVQEMLDGVAAEIVVDRVLETVECPL